MLNDLLQKTFDIKCSIEVYHRRLLNKGTVKHRLIGEIKDCLCGYIDTIGEDVMLAGEDVNIEQISVEAIAQDDDAILEDIYNMLMDYHSEIRLMQKAFSDDLEIQNDLIEVGKKIRFYCALLQGDLEEEKENEMVFENEDIPTIARPYKKIFK